MFDRRRKQKKKGEASSTVEVMPHNEGKNSKSNNSNNDVVKDYHRSGTSEGVSVVDEISKEQTRSDGVKGYHRTETSEGVSVDVVTTTVVSSISLGTGTVLTPTADERDNIEKVLLDNNVKIEYRGRRTGDTASTSCVGGEEGGFSVVNVAIIETTSEEDEESNGQPNEVKKKPIMKHMVSSMTNDDEDYYDLNPTDQQHVQSLINSVQSCWNQYEKESKKEGNLSQSVSNMILGNRGGAAATEGASGQNGCTNHGNGVDDNNQHHDDTLLHNGYDGGDVAGSYKQMKQQMLQDVKLLLRILKARQYCIEKSTHLFFEQVRFQCKWKPKSLLSDKSTTRMLMPNAYNSGAWRFCGYSRQGHVITNYKIQYWNPDDYGRTSESNNCHHNGSLEAGIREYTYYVLYMLESIISKSVKQDQFVIIFDLKGFTTSMVFKRNVRYMIGKLIYVAQTQYPERLYKAYIVNAPRTFTVAWNLIKALLDPKTVAKVTFCTKLPNDIVEKTNDKNGDNGCSIPLDVLSKEYGGTHPEYDSSIL